MATIRELVAKLGLDVDAQSFAKGALAADAVKGALQLAVDAAIGLGRAMVGAVTGTADTADRMDELAQQTGVSVKTLQELGYAASFSGVGVEELSKALNFMAKKGVKDVQGELFRLSDQMKQLPEEGGSRAAFAIEHLGKAGARLVPVLNQGGDALRAMAAEADEMGVVLDGDTIKSGVRFNDALDRMKWSLTGLRNLIVGPLLESLSDLAEGFVDWVRVNRELLKTKLRDFLVGMVKVLKQLGTVLGIVVKGMAQLIHLWKVAAALLGGTLTALLLTHIAALAAAEGGYIALALASARAGLSMVASWLAAIAPIALLGLAIAALILIVEDIWTSMNGGKGVMMDLMEAWTRFYQAWLNEPSDNWLLNAVKAVLLALSDLPGAISQAVGFWRDAFGRLWDWMKEKVSQAAGWIREKFASVISSIPGGEFILGKMQASVDAGEAAAPDAAALFGGGSSPAASSAVSSTSSSKTVAPMSVQMNISQQPGENGADLAGRVRQEVESFHNARLREAKAATGG